MVSKIKYYKGLSDKCRDTDDCSKAVENCKKRKSEAIKNLSNHDIKKAGAFVAISKGCEDDWKNDCNGTLEKCKERVSKR